MGVGGFGVGVGGVRGTAGCEVWFGLEIGCLLFSGLDRMSIGHVSPVTTESQK